MMEPTSTSALGQPPLPSANPAAPAAAAPAAGNQSAAAAAQAAAQAAGTAMLRQLSSIQVPKAIKDKTDDLEKRINATDIARINGYMRVVNLVAAALLAVTCFIRMWESPSYSHFLVIIYIMILAAGLAFIENHERFPSIADKVKYNFGFMFSAKGKAAYILSISFLAFSQGWIGCILGGAFFILALFNFFLIYRHPAYQAHMTKTEAQQQQEEDLEAMPELRYNQSQPAVVAVAASSGAATAHVVV